MFQAVWLSANIDLEEAKTNIEVFVIDVQKKCVSSIYGLETQQNMPQGIWYLSVLVHRRTIFRPVKSTPKSALIRDKIAKIGQIGPRRPYFTFAMLKNTQS